MVPLTIPTAVVLSMCIGIGGCGCPSSLRVRHNIFASRVKLKNDQLNAQKVTTMQMELDRLHGAAVRGNGLDAVRINRMNTLKSVIASYK